jgi:DNA (cytosine-5)-methyltransferase 1
MSIPTLNLDHMLRLSTALVPPRDRYAVKVRRGPRITLERHPESPDPTNLRATRAWVKAADGPTAIDLFCGAGGLSLGLAEAGFRLLAGADSDPYALETYAANLPGLAYYGDLTDPTDFLQHLTAWGVRRVDLVAGGVPCQPFSRAGRSKMRSLVQARVRHEDDARVDLWKSFIQVVSALRPRAVLLENVPDLAEWNEGAVLVGFCESLRELGYTTDARILAAHQHGVPQHRSRLFIVGLRGRRSFNWPSPKKGKSPTLWDAISDLPVVDGGQREEQINYDRPLTSLQRHLRSELQAIDRHLVRDHITREVRPDDLEAFLAIPEGGTYKDVPVSLRRYRSDIFVDKYKRLSRNELSRTITAHIAKDGYSYIHPVQNRTLSIREAARVQTFPDRFRFAGEPSHRYRAIGNAVPPLLGESMGAALKRALSETHHPPRRAQHQSFRDELMKWHSSNGRTYSWRSGATPWAVLLAEMCLHRTRADQVQKVFPQLLKLAPTPDALVNAREGFSQMSASLGLRWRTDNIVRVAELLVEQFDGRVPDTLDGLMRLPGVGDYVANAVLCFGFGRPAILVDTNTERIVGRVIGQTGSRGAWKRRLGLYRLAGPRGADSPFNYALLDLGALVCRASSPRCDSCPVARHCAMAGSRN